MALYDILLAKQLAGSGGGGGGGGDSDFSTAQVTIQSDLDYPTSFAIPVVYEENVLGEGAPACVYPTLPIEDNEWNTYTVALYKGTAVAIFSDDSKTFTLSGDVVEITEGFFMITGDCSIYIDY